MVLNGIPTWAGHSDHPPALCCLLSSHPFLQAENLLADSLGVTWDIFDLNTDPHSWIRRSPYLMRSFRPLTSCQRTPHQRCPTEAHRPTPACSFQQPYWMFFFRVNQNPSLLSSATGPTSLYITKNNSDLESIGSKQYNSIASSQVNHSGLYPLFTGKGRYTSLLRSLSSEWCATKSQIRKDLQKQNNHFTTAYFAFWQRTRSIETVPLFEAMVTRLTHNDILTH